MMIIGLWQTLGVLLFMVATIVSDGHTGPAILTEPGLFRSHVGSNVALPCNISGLGDLVLLWKQGSRIIFAGNIKVRRDERFERVGNTLKISDVNEKDNGEYTCEVETKDRNNPKSITHKLLVLQRPKIFTSSSQHNLTVIKGSSVVLNCAASGNPEPIIVWTKRNRDLAGLDHRLSENGKKLNLQNISENHAGRYTCTADNGVGNPVSEDITLKVLYPPEASAERSIVLGGEDCSIELVCNVEGFPVPTVHWYRGTMKLVPNNNIRIVSTGMRNRLTFIKFSFNDASSVGFTCSGSSPLGTSEANFTVKGIPGTPVFGPNVTEIEPSKFLLEWATPSFSNILEHSLIYKQVKDKSSPSLLTYGENKLKIPNMVKTKLNCSGRTQPNRQRFDFLLDKLEPGTRYQVRLNAKNHHGWGETSQPITFKTSQFIGQPPQESQILPLSDGNLCENSSLLVSILIMVHFTRWM
eukprot:TRINITY_DN15378_c0_g1_i1.p1 TRINITY_DN15378_c0_g1~~TRINITY_DN15378_c0_g1_i1.p1  ORF type:complete len:468 (-),score=49.34 TRINITY_DN15378_c0_g1_i1:75-1478(-)